MNKKYWIAVASREHVLRGVSVGICQVCHGKAGPLRQMHEGDFVIYYSPTERFGQKDPCQRFTALGRVLAKEPYQFQMSEDFVPWRRDLCFFAVREVSILPLLNNLSFITDKKRWGFPFRRGLFSIPAQDFTLIATKMGLDFAEGIESARDNLMGKGLDLF